MSRARSAALPSEWIDEIPTRASSSKAGVVSVAAIMLLGLGVAAWRWAPDALESFLGRNMAIAILFENNHVSTVLECCFWAE